jgi:hypothetical protein
MGTAKDYMSIFVPDFFLPSIHLLMRFFKINLHIYYLPGAACDANCEAIILKPG